jgi:L,D-transpeptidase catalytic domain
LATAVESSAAKDTGAPEKSEVKSEAAAKPAPPPEPTLTAKIDLGKQTMVVSEDGDVKYSWPISSGAEEFPTPRGTFRPQWVAKMWYSRKYDNAPMPNAVFISGGVAIHATQHVSSLGRPASHGCIRLAPGNAKTFYNLVGKHGLKMTRVSVYGNPKWRSPAVAARNVPSRRYAARQDSGSWFSSPKQYRQVSAYDPGFTQRQYRQVYRPVPRGYYYADAPRRVYYQRRNNNRVVYVQRPQRRYYYNSSGYGYGYGGGW